MKFSFNCDNNYFSSPVERACFPKTQLTFQPSTENITDIMKTLLFFLALTMLTVALTGCTKTVRLDENRGGERQQGIQIY